MDARLEQRVRAAIKAYQREVEEWWPLASSIPVSAVISRERLARLVALEAPDLIVGSEIELLTSRVLSMKERRLGVRLQ
jgi:hypothetical protein